MENYEYPAVFSDHIHNRTVYIHSAVEANGSVRILSRNEIVDRVLVFMYPFWVDILLYMSRGVLLLGC